MPVNYKKARLSDRYDVAFYFNNLQDVQLFTKEKLDTIPVTDNKYRIISDYTDNLSNYVQRFANRGDSWFGTTDTSWATSPVNNFLRTTELNNDITRLNQNFARVDVIDIDQQKKLEFTEKEIGIFSFDLASLGLIRMYQYFSPLLSDYVDNNLVQSYKNNNGDLIFYYVGTPYIPRHEVPFDLKKGFYYSDILNRRVDTSELIEVVPDDPNLPIQFFYPEKEEIPRHNVEGRQKIDKSGNKKFATTYKKCFIDIPKTKGRLPRLDLIITMNYASTITAQQIYWNTISILLVANKLSTAGINFRIIGTNCGSTDNLNLYTFVNLKDESQPIDTNSLAIAISDSRYFRTQGVPLTFAIVTDENLKSDIDASGKIPNNNLADIKQKYIEFLSLQTSQTDREAATRPETKIMFPQALSEQQAINAYNTVIQQIQGQLVI
jgi:hypothetical protein